ncbi:MAG TPA: GtrA family protein [Noviherbaspirillum sp.]|uniref:GtrA family protein n=1 Tax=Noviherbaspirillum sp. TaxID=1926288 RepID=UPI002B485E99|nr:GtrA family protein [Noviherbaspirillum sp.]HJV84295.1 GtrA family protein [Noviherbaspirillum sp.]
MGQFIRYIIVGVANTIVGYGIIFGCMYLLGMSPEASNIAGYAVGLMVSYVLNRNYTFNSTQGRRTEFMRFLVVFAIAYGLNFVALLVLIHQLGVHEGVSQVVAGAVYVVSAFLMNKYYVFKIRHAG